MAIARHSNQRITLVMLLLISITVLTLDYHGEANRAIGHIRNGFEQVASPFQRAAQSVLHPVGDVASAMFHYGSLETENSKLRDENGALERQLYADQYTTKVEQAVGALADLPFVGSLPTIPAQVTGRSSSNFEQTLELNQGWSSGVGAGMPVVGQGGLVGSIVSASESTSVVLLLSDRRQAIDVGDSAGRSFLLKGGGGGEALSLQQLVSSTAPAKGERLTTTGQSNGVAARLFPGGIPVGVVTTSIANPGGLATGTVRPLVDVDTLEYVTVLEWLPSA